MKIILHHRTDYHQDKPIETYSRSWARVFRELGHACYEVGEGNSSIESIEGDWDLLFDVDCGRNSKGQLNFLGEEGKKVRARKRAVYLIDTHGRDNDTLHRRLASFYDYVFFAVWRCRDTFANFDSHWLPNFTDTLWFSPDIGEAKNDFDIGFFGSKHGLDRADNLIEICNRNNLTYDVRQINKNTKHRWPYTAESMNRCSILFNKGQKGDGPNLRVMESMAMKKPLLCDIDVRDGMSRLFKEGIHYVGYWSKEGLEDGLLKLHQNQEFYFTIAENGYHEVLKNHTIYNRVKQVLETVK